MRSLIPLLLVSVACIEYQPDTEYPSIAVPNPQELVPEIQEDKYLQIQPPEVDVLFVVDNSCSMSDEQRELSDAFPQFMNFFLGSNLDYHIGVVSTDMYDESHQGRLRRVGTEKYIDPSTQKPLSVFTEMAGMGISGSGDERGLEAAYVALRIRKDDYNYGFLRELAPLHIIVISDEEDSSERVSIDQFVYWAHQEGFGPGTLTWSSIIAQKTNCGVPGYQYMALTNTLGGILWSICNPNWDEVLEQLGLQASGLKVEFFLSRLPVYSTIDVLVVEDGVTFAFKPDRDWDYDLKRNSITFAEYIPSPLAEVNIRYQVL